MPSSFLQPTDLPNLKEYEMVSADELSIKLVKRVPWLLQKYGLKNKPLEDNLINLMRIYQLEFPGRPEDNKFYIIERRWINITDPRSGNDYDRAEYIITEKDEIFDLDNTLFFMSVQGADKFRYDFEKELNKWFERWQ